MKKLDSFKFYVSYNEHTAFECEYVFMDNFKWANGDMGVALRKRRTEQGDLPQEKHTLCKLSDWKGALCL